MGDGKFAKLYTNVYLLFMYVELKREKKPFLFERVKAIRVNVIFRSQKGEFKIFWDTNFGERSLPPMKADLSGVFDFEHRL